jgi:hypothetical protein
VRDGATGRTEHQRPAAGSGLALGKPPARRPQGPIPRRIDPHFRPIRELETEIPGPSVFNSLVVRARAAAVASQIQFNFKWGSACRRMHWHVLSAVEGA